MLEQAVTNIAALPPLDDDERDDACYRGQDLAWSSLAELFDHYHRTQGLTYEALGKRIRRTRSQVQRWLGSSFGMNIKSLGLLAEGLDADLTIEVRPRVKAAASRNYCHPREAARANREIGITANCGFWTTFDDHVGSPTSTRSGAVITDVRVQKHVD